MAALALLRIPSPVAARFVDPALMRQTLLDGTFKRIGDSLDFDHVARELMSSLVPHFCNSGGVAVLESLIGDDEFPSDGPGRHAAAAAAGGGQRRRGSGLGSHVPDR